MTSISLQTCYRSGPSSEIFPAVFQYIGPLSHSAEILNLQPWHKGPKGTSMASPPNAFESAKALRFWFSFRGYSAVAKFLFQNPDLVAVLLDAYIKIANFVPGALRPILEVVTDTESGKRKLFLLVRTASSVKEARAMLRTFDEKWWLDASEMVGDRLNIDLEFV